VLEYAEKLTVYFVLGVGDLMLEAACCLRRRQLTFGGIAVETERPRGLPDRSYRTTMSSARYQAPDLTKHSLVLRVK
jgi:hypothetical protein